MATTGPAQKFLITFVNKGLSSSLGYREVGSLVFMPQAATKDGYSFVGWKSSYTGSLYGNNCPAIIYGTTTFTTIYSSNNSSKKDSPSTNKTTYSTKVITTNNSTINNDETYDDYNHSVATAYSGGGCGYWLRAIYDVTSNYDANGALNSYDINFKRLRLKANQYEDINFNNVSKSGINIATSDPRLEWYLESNVALPNGKDWWKSWQRHRTYTKRNISNAYSYLEGFSANGTNRPSTQEFRNIWPAQADCNWDGDYKNGASLSFPGLEPGKYIFHMQFRHSGNAWYFTSGDVSFDIVIDLTGKEPIIEPPTVTSTKNSITAVVKYNTQGYALKSLKYKCRQKGTANWIINTSGLFYDLKPNTQYEVAAEIETSGGKKTVNADDIYTAASEPAIAIVYYKEGQTPGIPAPVDLSLYSNRNRFSFAIIPDSKLDNGKYVKDNGIVLENIRLQYRDPSTKKWIDITNSFSTWDYEIEVESQKRIYKGALCIPTSASYDTPVNTELEYKIVLKQKSNKDQSGIEYSSIIFTHTWDSFAPYIITNGGKIGDYVEVSDTSFKIENSSEWLWLDSKTTIKNVYGYLFKQDTANVLNNYYSLDLNPDTSNINLIDKKELYDKDENRIKFIDDNKVETTDSSYKCVFYIEDNWGKTSPLYVINFQTKVWSLISNSNNQFSLFLASQMSEDDKITASFIFNMKSFDSKYTNTWVKIMCIENTANKNCFDSGWVCLKDNENQYNSSSQLIEVKGLQEKIDHTINIRIIRASHFYADTEDPTQTREAEKAETNILYKDIYQFTTRQRTPNIPITGFYKNDNGNITRTKIDTDIPDYENPDGSAIMFVYDGAKWNKIKKAFIYYKGKWR